MKPVSLTAFPRTLTRRSRVRKLRAQGRIPAVIYGRGARPENLEVGLRELELLIHHSASEIILVDLALSGASAPNRLALLQEVQHHPLDGSVLHVDFHEVAADEKVTIHVPVESEGEPIGVKTGGGVLEHVLFKLKLRCLPKDLPEVIRVDVTRLEVGGSIHIGEIPAIPGVEILGDRKVPVFSVAAPLTEVQEAAVQEAAAAAAPAQPVMLKEKKEEGAPAPAEKKK